MGEIESVGALLQIAKEVSKAIKGEKFDSLQLDCMDNLGKYTTTISVDNRFQRLYRSKEANKKLSKDEVYNVKVFQLKPFPSQVHEAVTQTPEFFEVNLSKVANFELVRIEVDFRLKPDCLDGLVKSRSSPEPLEDSTKFKLSAMLTDPSSLTPGFSDVEIEEFPVTARVYIQENLDTAYPILSSIRKLKKVEQDMAKITDPHKAVEVMRLQKQKYLLHTRIKREAPNEILREIMSLVGPSKFRKYLSSTSNEFRLHKCEWSAVDTLLSFASFSLPREMLAVTRTDLSLAKPASNGELVYEFGRFQADIGEIISSRESKRQKHDRRHGRQQVQ